MTELCKLFPYYEITITGKYICILDFEKYPEKCKINEYENAIIDESELTI